MKRFPIHHIGIAVWNLESALPNYETLLDYKLIAGPVSDPIQRVSVCFLSRGEEDTVIELVAPLGPNSPVDRTLKKGGGPYHICYQVSDINAAISHFTAQGSLLLSGPSRPWPLK